MLSTLLFKYLHSETGNIVNGERDHLGVTGVADRHSEEGNFRKLNLTNSIFPSNNCARLKVLKIV